MYKSFKKMPVWEEAMSLATSIFNLTVNLPKSEDYGFTSQIRRSALSISANNTEAFGRNHLSEKINFYYYCRGSIAETQNHLEYGKRIGYFETNDEFIKLNEQLSNLFKNINQIIVTLKSKPKTKS
jgi:four helix bundle protein